MQHLLALLLLFLLVHKCGAAEPSIPATEAAGSLLTLEQHVRPILRAYCLDCHGGEEELQGSLDLRLRRFMIAGGDSGAAIVPSDPESSLLLQRMRSGEMPPGEKKVPLEQIEMVAQWIAQGSNTLRDEPETIPPGIGISEEERSYWAFQPIRRPEIPTVVAADRVRTPIDAFLLSKLQQQGLILSPDADKLTLIRRVAFDLTGLPPQQTEIDRFISDESPSAYEQMVERMLASPHYGERWGRHWLDVAGYADSDGFTGDAPRPYAYKYRDYVIRSLNADKPLNQFVMEQLAGDEMIARPSGNLTDDQIEKLTATGFLRMAADGTGQGGDELLARNQVIGDMLKIVSSSLLGVTVGCAQCHDHRYDPIPQEDYFRLRAVFEPVFDCNNWRGPQQRLISLYTDADRQKAAEVEAQVAVIAQERATKQAEFIEAAFQQELTKFPEPLREQLRVAFNTPADQRSAEQNKLVADNPKLNISPGVLYQYNQGAADELKKFDDRIDALRATKPVEDFISIADEVPGELPITHLFYRGDHRQPKQAVEPGDLTVLSPPGTRFTIAADDTDLATSGRRLAFAKHLVSGQHPLAGRVLANWIWLHHFGRGIVETPGDFGKLGTPPTHPELLDWLASELVQRSWSLKDMHRLILTSTAYRQSSAMDPAKAAVDSGNRLYWRMPVKRLEAEAIRDRMLVVSGKFDRAMYGPAVPVTEDAVGQVIVPEGVGRRSVYLQVKRNKPVAFLTTFDAPVMETNCDRRSTSTVSPQALMLMNGDFVLQQAKLFAERLQNEAPLTEPLAAAAALPVSTSVWQAGFGHFDSASGKVSLQPFPHWTGSAWQAGPVLPDPQHGWVLLTATGGHTGGDAQHAVVRRWTAPAAGKLLVSGKLEHASPHGDGIRGRLVSSSTGLLGEWVAKTSSVVTSVEVQVQAGETVDFVVDCIENENSDSFTWTADVMLSAENLVRSWNTANGFSGPAGAPLHAQVAHAWRTAYHREITPDEASVVAEFLHKQLSELESKGSKNPQLEAMTNLCQQLLSSNEFLYVD